MQTIFDALFIAALFAPPAVLLVSAVALVVGRPRRQPAAPSMRRAA